MGLNIDGHNIADIYIGTVHIDKIYVGETLVYQQQAGPMPLYFEAVDPSIQSSVSISMVATADYDPAQSTEPDYQEPAFEYSYNGTTWNAYTNGTGISIGGANPSRVYFRGDNHAHTWRDVSSASGYKLPIVAITGGAVNSGGNIMSLLWSDLSTPRLTLPFDYTFAYFFTGCDKLVTPPELPATTVSVLCYNYMFLNCSSLETAPELPAETLADNCYQFMFNGCTALEQGPTELPATTLTQHCYDGMFRDCAALETAPYMNATTLADYCCQNMFYGCTSLETAPALPATVAPKYCYSGMFRDCTSLVNIPASLPATTLGAYCYASMFRGSGITAAPALPATDLVNYCYQHMFRECSNLTTPCKLPATTVKAGCYQYMFRYCPMLNSVPELPATTLQTACYGNMFNNSINAGASQTASLPYAYRVPKTGTGTTATQALQSMFLNESGAGTYTPTINTTFYISKPILT